MKAWRVRYAAGRSAQIVAVLALSLVAVPVCAVIACAILLTGGRPVLFWSRRLGRGGRPFDMVKFRTMSAGADGALASVLASSPECAAEWRAGVKLSRDPRVTSLGQFLRRTSLDELPQLWNVLLGDMNLIGPRPVTEAERWRYGEAFDEAFSVKPGMTGLWQVSGRNNLPYSERVRLDVRYARCHTLWLDMVILFKTAWEILAGHGK